MNTNFGGSKNKFTIVVRTQIETFRRVCVRRMAITNNSSIATDKKALQESLVFLLKTILCVIVIIGNITCLYFSGKLRREIID